MLIVHVQVQVKPESVAAFKAMTPRSSTPVAALLEPGVLRFDFLQQADDPARFTLIEIYRDVPATNALRTGRRRIILSGAMPWPPMMAAPRVSYVKFNQVSSRRASP